VKSGVLSLGLGLVGVALLAGAARADVDVVIGGIEGRNGGTRAIADLQTELKRMGGVRIHTTKEFTRAAEGDGVADRLPGDARALSRLAVYLQIDAVVYGRFAGGKRGDQTLQMTVYNGGDGRVLGEHDFPVPGGKVGRSLWRQVAETIEPDLHHGDHHAAARVEPVEPTPAPVAQPTVLPVEPVAEAETHPEREAKSDLLRLRAGLSFMSRSFNYTAADDSAQFTDGGIRYDSSLAPGVVVEAELYPLASSTDGFAKDIGVGFRFEKVFLSTKQEVTLEDGTTEQRNLDTKHQHLAFDLRYRHRFGADELSPELSVFAGLGLLDFELQHNDEYRGTNYKYWRLGLGATVPFGTPLIGADVRLQYFPSADMGDTVEEVGDSASTSGFGIYAGLVSHFADDFSVHAGFDLTSLDSDVKGEGRGGRIGKSAEDRFLGARVMAGWRL
jgi:hypothetical protein